MTWLFEAEGVKPDIDAIDWGIIADGEGAVESFSQATTLCSDMAAASGANYNVGDPVCFMSLPRLAEAQKAANDKFPRFPSEVTIEGDLGLVENENAKSVITASGAHKRARVDGSGNSAAKVCRADVLTMLFDSDILPVCALSARALSHCCRGLRDARQKHMRKKRQAVADSVATWLSQPDLEPVLKPHGVTKGGIRRTVVCSWD